MVGRTGEVGGGRGGGRTLGQRRGEKKKTHQVKKKKHIGQGGCSSAKRAERAHPQLVHWWLLIHSSRP